MNHVEIFIPTLRGPPSSAVAEGAEGVANLEANMFCFALTAIRRTSL
jgi:hypothetical protein